MKKDHAYLQKTQTSAIGEMNGDLRTVSEERHALAKTISVYDI